MTKREFLRRMAKAKILVESDQFNGVCWALQESFKRGREPFKAFGENFNKYPHQQGYFLDDVFNTDDNMTELERRLVFLESFKGFCEAYELYKEWS